MVFALCLALFLSVTASLSLALISLRDSSKIAFQEFYGFVSANVVALALASVLLIINILISLSLLYLFTLHLFLRSRGLTTYKFILMLRERRAIKQEN